MRNRISVCFLIIFALFTNLYAQEMTKSEAKSAREKFVAAAKQYVGCPYELGAIGPDKFDCSGLIYHVARTSVGIQLPRTAKAIYNFVRRVPDEDREVGDLLFFKTTTSGNISHVGIFIGNNQFISAISDGPNTGVIISSLNQTYWKDKYVSCGQFLPSGSMYDFEPEYEEEVVVLDEETGETATAKRVKQKNKTAKSVGNGASFIGGLIFDTTVEAGWSLFSPKQFMIRYRGIDVQINARESNWFLQPGIGVDLRFNSSLGIFQMPILLSGMANDYIRFYAGPVISFKPTATLIATEKEIKPSFFPGIIGAAITTPAIESNGIKLQLVQDISYTVFNNLDNAALSFAESICAGLVMYTGIKITLPMTIFM